MKKWRCKVCGYIHQGSEPPDECPVCGAVKSEFEEVIESSTGIGDGLQDHAGTSPMSEKSADKSAQASATRDSASQQAGFS